MPALFDQAKSNLGSAKRILMMKLADSDIDCSGESRYDQVKKGKMLNGKTCDVSLATNQRMSCASNVASCVARPHALGWMSDCLQSRGRRLPTRALGNIDTLWSEGTLKIFSSAGRVICDLIPRLQYIPLKIALRLAPLIATPLSFRFLYLSLLPRRHDEAAGLALLLAMQ